ncbi:Integrase core domain [Cedecea neteri]|uniref:Integrase core domain n=1 Tax=Cedecea neteri TaxID=158822 RepID=A0A2X3KXB7_9ENTR|nr:Integrase core domain [Cedecea neteri]
MGSGSNTHVAGHVFINPDTGVTALENLFRSMVPRMTGLKDVPPKCCLLVFIDDATGRLMHLRFGETESAFDYMMATREYLEQHGKPLAFYSDKHGIFRVNNGGTTTTGITQFGRVLSELGIELICANSPQAKGRVERANQTLQDRLIKEMRLEGISSIEDANAWLDSFIIDFNRRFARPAKYPKGPASTGG